jgi:hypothetical protein
LPCIFRCATRHRAVNSHFSRMAICRRLLSPPAQASHVISSHRLGVFLPSGRPFAMPLAQRATGTISWPHSAITRSRSRSSAGSLIQVGSSKMFYDRAVGMCPALRSWSRTFCLAAIAADSLFSVVRRPTQSARVLRTNHRPFHPKGNLTLLNWGDLGRSDGVMSSTDSESESAMLWICLTQVPSDLSV